MTTSVEQLQQAQALGIAPSFSAFTGERQTVDTEVLEQFITLLSLPPAQAEDFCDVFVIPAEQSHCLKQTALNANLIDEAGNRQSLSLNEDGISLPPLAIGYYELQTDSGKFFIISAPSHCYEAPALSQDNKLTGLNVQLYSLRSENNWGIGDFGDIQALAKHFAGKGIDFIGLNPLHALFSSHPEWASPYSPTSKSRLNTIYLDVNAVPEFQACPNARQWWKSTDTQARLNALRAAEYVDYVGVFALKQQALELAFAYFQDSQDAQTQARREAFAAFVQEGGKDLYGHAVFEVLDRHFQSHSAQSQQAPQREEDMGWLAWADDYQHIDSPAVQVFIGEHQAEIDYCLWLQWLTEEQLAQTQILCQAAGMSIGLYGDLAVGVARGGSDTWTQREAFCLNASVGAPPDPLGPQGQNWQLPPLHPQLLRRHAYGIFIDMLRANMRHYGMLRIDHVMAFERLWWILQDQGADKGAYVHYPLEEMMAILAVESQRAQCVVVGEDLGIVSDEMRAALRRYGVYSFAVLYFMKSDGEYIAPADWEAKAIAVVSTHDLAPLAAYWQGEDIDLLRDLSVLKTEEQYLSLVRERTQDKRSLSQQLGYGKVQEYSADLVKQLHVHTAAAAAQLFAFQLENLLPCHAPFNVPGISRDYPNWRVKLPFTLEDLLANSALSTQITAIVEARRHDATAVQALNPRLSADSQEQQIIDALCEARLADPFAYLGAHAHSQGIIVRTYQPEADKVELCIGEESYLMQCIDKRGVFVRYLADYAPFTHYQLRVYHDKRHRLIEDPYRFGAALGELDNWLLAQGRHLRPYEQLGAHLCCLDGVEGTRFGIWAPNALRVSVIGDFNQWDGRRHPMRLHPGSGVWELFIPHIGRGELYKFEILDVHHHCHIKADPYAFAAELRPATASKISGLPEKIAPNPQQQARLQSNRPISIYEVHLGSWRRNTENNFWLNYRQIADKLIPYVKSMGFTHIELMPIAEFPFDGSWGYQATGLYAPTSRFGDPEGLRFLIERAHEAGIGVLLDWVVGHFPDDAHGLAHFDGTALYEHADPREGYHQDWNTLIFNYGRHEVRNFLSGNALYWIERFGIDGLRVDAVASMIYRDYSRAEGQWIPNRYGGRENLEAIDFLRETNQMLRSQTGASSIAEESTSFMGVTHQDGLAFDYKWNMGWMNDTLRYMQQDPIHRKHHHQLITFGMMYQYSEQFMLPLSHDEVVHGKGSLLDKMPGDCWQKFANLRAYYGYMWGYPGKKLLFMGNEFAQGREWNYQESLDWYLLDEAHGGWHSGMQAWVRDLNHFYQAQAALFEQDYQPQGFEWRVVDDAEQSVFAFERIAANGARILVVSNFTPVPRHDYRIGVPLSGYYRETLNSDAACYQGSGMGNQGGVASEAITAHQQPHSIKLTLPPLSTLFFALEA